jgi:transcriptional regulator with XRE-family HTH domain
MHEYRRFIQAELDARGWEPADLVRRSGLRRQLVWKILHDERDALGQMPDEATLEKLATGFGVKVERVRTAAARSLARYSDDGQPIGTSLADVDVDVLLAEVRRRILAGTSSTGGAGSDALINKMGRRRRGQSDEPEDPSVAAAP